MSVDLPSVKTQRTRREDMPAPSSLATPSVEPGADWRDSMVSMARSTALGARSRDRVKNPMVPDNFLDVSEAGFPSDIVVLPVSIPRPGVPAEMDQYRRLINYQWLHVPWDFISKNGGEDGKAFVPGAERYDLGGGHFVAVLAGHYLMFASREQYQNRRTKNVQKSTEALQYKMDQLQEQTQQGGKIWSEASQSGQMTLDELLEYEKQIGDEAALTGVRIEAD